MQSTKQLNVWIPEELRDYIAERAEEEGCGMNKIVADLIRNDIAQRKGEFTRQTSLTVLQEILVRELHQTHAQLRQHLREDRAEEREDLWETLKKQFDRVAGLTVNATRNGGIARRLLYVLLSKTHGSNFAKEAYDYAAKKTNEDLTPKKKFAIEQYALIEETPAAETSNGHA
ncbi:MAG TPA: Arc family DNA-binding protein [Ktedonobacteraceae bacterium]|nr:Arc family DNA-binding protein [Ktedonobacteraceae bacterium]